VPDPGFWRDAVVYQLYLRSFADADGDGVGDLRGATARLGHVARLGVDAVWLSPFYPSGGVDGGYDVVDHCAVDPEYGTLADLDAFISTAHALGLRIVIDLVPNHSSSRHPWFLEALTAGPGSAARERYLFRAGRGEGGMLPPTNWWGTDDGSAWTLVRDAEGAPELDEDGRAQWYLHLFDRGQPDWDWTHPDVQGLFDEVLRFWLARGVDGFRVDVAHGMAKAAGLPDWHPPAEARAVDGGMVMHTADERYRPPMWDQEGVHAIFTRWRDVLDGWRERHGGGERALFGEAWVEHERARRYVRAGELDQVFDAAFLVSGWSAPALRAGIDGALTAFAEEGTAPCWVLSNHDVVRAASRFGYPPDTALPYGIGADDPQPNAALGERRARAALLLLLALPGAAVLYQGDELALPEVTDLPDEARQDPVWASSHGHDRGRDGCRVPLPWTANGPSFGFNTTGQSWLPQPEWWGLRAVESQGADPSSALRLTRHALALRRTHALGRSAVRWMDAPPGVLLFRTGDIVVATNTTGEPVEVAATGEPVLASAAGAGGAGSTAAASGAATGSRATAGTTTIPADTTLWLRQPAACPLRVATDNTPAASTPPRLGRGEMPRRGPFRRIRSSPGQIPSPEARSRHSAAGQMTSALQSSGLPKRCAVMAIACSCRNGSSSSRPAVVTSLS